ncbi:MAG: hypothetical protein HGA78_01620 [Nitrospirales bacterium]|nr:hypothetical protein [Nitrospirales bacterium]
MTHNSPGSLKRIESGKYGFFSKPFLATSGPFIGKIVKQYHDIGDRELCAELVRVHDRYADLLRKAGISVPETEILLREGKKRKYTIMIVQEAFPETALVRNIMLTAGLDECSRLMKGIIDDAVTVLNFMREHPEENMGFHPTLRNYAVTGEKLHYFDTFPPFCLWDQRRVEKIILDFAPFPLVRHFKPFLLPFMHRVTDEYYFDDKMILGIVGSSCRLRPEFYQQFLDSAAKHLRNMTEGRVINKEGILHALSQPPSLSPLWVMTRRLLGKEGKPNLKR